MAGFNPVIAASGDNKLDVWGATDVAYFTLAFTASDTYTTGGFAMAAATYGLSRPILSVVVEGQNTAGAGIVWMWNTQTAKLQGFVGSAGGAYAASAALGELPSSSALIQSVTLTVRITTQR